MSAKIKAFVEKYPYIWAVSYFIVYMIWFVWLESRANEPYHVIHFPLDDYIPFCEYFVIPYLLWFAYIAVVYVWMFLHDRKQFFRYISFIYTGMTLFLIISTIYPNGHLLRPLERAEDDCPRQSCAIAKIQLLAQVQRPCAPKDCAPFDRQADGAAHKKRQRQQETDQRPGQEQEEGADQPASTQQDRADDLLRAADAAHRRRRYGAHRRGRPGAARVCVRGTAFRAGGLRRLPFHQLIERHAEKLREPHELVELRDTRVRLPLAHRLAADVQHFREIAL